MIKPSCFSPKCPLEVHTFLGHSIYLLMFKTWFNQEGPRVWGLLLKMAHSPWLCSAHSRVLWDSVAWILCHNLFFTLNFYEGHLETCHPLSPTWVKKTPFIWLTGLERSGSLLLAIYHCPYSCVSSAPPTTRSLHNHLPRGTYFPTLFALL
jgi:hypothetical protein